MKYMITDKNTTTKTNPNITMMILPAKKKPNITTKKESDPAFFNTEYALLLLTLPCIGCPNGFESPDTDSTILPILYKICMSR